MTTFKGVGPGKKGGWKNRRYNLSTGEVSEGAKPRRKKGVGLSMRFVPFVSRQPHKKDAEALGLHYDQKTKATHFTSERQLNEYLAREKRLGRETGWRDY